MVLANLRYVTNRLHGRCSLGPSILQSKKEVRVSNLYNICYCAILFSIQLNSAVTVIAHSFMEEGQRWLKLVARTTSVCEWHGTPVALLIGVLKRSRHFNHLAGSSVHY